MERRGLNCNFIFSWCINGKQRKELGVLYISNNPRLLTLLYWSCCWTLRSRPAQTRVLCYNYVRTNSLDHWITAGIWICLTNILSKNVFLSIKICLKYLVYQAWNTNSRVGRCCLDDYFLEVTNKHGDRDDMMTSSKNNGDTRDFWGVYP